MKKTINLVALVLGLTTCKGNIIDEKTEAIRMLRSSGWTQVRISDEVYGGCPGYEEFGIELKMSGINRKGKRTNATVCCYINTNDCSVEY